MAIGSAPAATADSWRASREEMENFPMQPNSLGPTGNCSFRPQLDDYSTHLSDDLGQTRQLNARLDLTLGLQF